MLNQNGHNTEHSAQPTAGLPMVISPERPRPSLARYQVPASFVSQLLAEKQRFATQRARRLAPNSTAIGAYAKGAQTGQRRMPAGYRLTTSI